MWKQGLSTFCKLKPHVRAPKAQSNWKWCVCELLSSGLFSAFLWGSELWQGHLRIKVIMLKKTPKKTKQTLYPILRLCAFWGRFSSRSSLYSAAFILHSIMPSLPISAAEYH